MIAARNRRRGFNLIEILIAILLIGILLAVAAPRLLGSREAAADSAAQQQLNTVAMAAQAVFTSRESYTDANELALQDKVQEVDLVAGPAGLVDGTSVRQVSVAVSGTGDVWTAAALGGGENCWFFEQSIAAANRYGTAPADAAGTCDASGTLAAVTWQAYGFPEAP